MAKRKIPTPAELVGRRVRELREARGLSQRALAEAVGLRPPDVSKIENGQAEIRGPHIGVVYRLAPALGVEPRDLVPTPVG